MIARRKLLKSAMLVAGAIVMVPREPVDASRKLYPALPRDGDLLLLVAPGRDPAALAEAIRNRAGHTAIRRIAPLERDGFAALDAMLARARDVQVAAWGDAAELLVIGTMLDHAGGKAIRTTMAGNWLLARL